MFENVEMRASYRRLEGENWYDRVCEGFWNSLGALFSDGGIPELSTRTVIHTNVDKVLNLRDVLAEIARKYTDIIGRSQLSGDRKRD